MHDSVKPLSFLCQFKSAHANNYIDIGLPLWHANNSSTAICRSCKYGHTHTHAIDNGLPLIFVLMHDSLTPLSFRCQFKAAHNILQRLVFADKSKRHTWTVALPLDNIRQRFAAPCVSLRCNFQILDCIPIAFCVYMNSGLPLHVYVLCLHRHTLCVYIAAFCRSWLSSRSSVLRRFHQHC